MQSPERYRQNEETNIGALMVKRHLNFGYCLIIKLTGNKIRSLRENKNGDPMDFFYFKGYV